MCTRQRAAMLVASTPNHKGSVSLQDVGWSKQMLAIVHFVSMLAVVHFVTYLQSGNMACILEDFKLMRHLV